MSSSIWLQEKSPCSTKNMPVPQALTCPRCGGEVEIWTDEDETHCLSCGYKMFNKESIIH